MIYYENNEIIAKCNIDEVILEEVESIRDNYFYWRVVPNEFYKDQLDYPSICNADTPEELKIWCDLHKMNVIGIYPLDMHKEIYGKTVVF